MGDWDSTGVLAVDGARAFVAYPNMALSLALYSARARWMSTLKGCNAGLAFARLVTTVGSGRCFLLTRITMLFKGKKKKKNTQGVAAYVYPGFRMQDF